MTVSYKKLWKLLIDRDISRASLRKQAGISSGSLTKLGRAEPVSMEVLWKVCSVLECNIGDVMEFELATTGSGRRKND